LERIVSGDSQAAAGHNRAMNRQPAQALLAIVAATLVAGCALGPAAPRTPALPPAVTQALQAAAVPEDALAAVAIPLGPHGTPWRYRADAPMQPASTMKLLTSIVALDRLGPGHRSGTEFRSAAVLDAGVLKGDLVLKGGADPDLNLPQFWQMLLDLRAAGITRIDGDLLLDRTLFRPTRSDIGLPPFDSSPAFQYNVIPDALELAGNLLPLTLRSGPAGSGVSATPVPPLDGLTLDASRMTLNARPCGDWDDDWQPARVQPSEGGTRIELQGAFPADCTQQTALQLIDRDELADRLFRTLWQGLGGRWAGRAREAAAPAGSRLLVQRTGRPLGEVLRPMNKTSDNPVTRMLFLQLGVPQMAANPQASTAELAAREVRRWLAEHGIDDAGLVLDNGSGLSRSERITPQQLAGMLAVSWRGPRSPDLMATLPIAGEDGSVRPLKDSPAAGWARLKPGTLRNVVALAGYVRDEQGQPWAVAMMINHDNASQARPALLALVDHFARVGMR
jgi:D-alanyl-D-alanine carboxypeptidase/D-alanyl-D-alanine-endopeptidase (penicillin-binding protein 4)